ncbi:MAG: YHS domain protein [Bacteroidia bacterium]|nr:YHS domain protein [Bacteroidia bacterium]
MLLFLSQQAFAGNDSDSLIRAKHWNIKQGIALNGFDPVSYFEGSPLKGIRDFKAIESGVMYFFASEKHREMFLLDPQKYEPACGGWCAYAMGKSGDKVKINPYCFKIIEDRLYLFYNKFGINTLKKWNKDETKLKRTQMLTGRRYFRGSSVGAFHIRSPGFPGLLFV